MKTNTSAIIGALLLSTAIFSHAATIDLPEYGFSIDALDSQMGPAPSTALMMFLPASDGFAPNLNVNIQPFPGSMKDYIALSTKQFESMKWTVVSEKQIGDTEWQVEYKGPMQGNDLHFYARAVQSKGRVYLVTGTAKETQWNTVGNILQAHVDSFKAK